MGDSLKVWVVVSDRGEVVGVFPDQQGAEQKADGLNSIAADRPKRMRRSYRVRQATLLFQPE